MFFPTIPVDIVTKLSQRLMLSSLDNVMVISEHRSDWRHHRMHFPIVLAQFPSRWSVGSTCCIISTHYISQNYNIYRSILFVCVNLEHSHHLNDGELIYLNKSLYYSIELYSLFPPLGFISNYRIMLGDIKIWGQGLVRAVLAVW